MPGRMLAAFLLVAGVASDSAMLFEHDSDANTAGISIGSTGALELTASACIDRSNWCGFWQSNHGKGLCPMLQSSAAPLSTAKFAMQDGAFGKITLHDDGTLRFVGPDAGCIGIDLTAPTAGEIQTSEQALLPQVVFKEGGQIARIHTDETGKLWIQATALSDGTNMLDEITPSPTPAPTAYPTIAPTPAPTIHACDDGSHGCDNEGGLCEVHENSHQWKCTCDFSTHWCKANCDSPMIGNDCQAFRQCTAEEYQTQAPTQNSDRQCAPVTACDSTQYQTQDRTATSDYECASLTICPATHFESVAPTATTDRECTEITNSPTKSPTKSPTAQKYCDPDQERVGQWGKCSTGGGASAILSCCADEGFVCWRRDGPLSDYAQCRNNGPGDSWTNSLSYMEPQTTAPTPAPSTHAGFCDASLAAAGSSNNCITGPAGAKVVHCCEDEGFECYRKNANYGQCRNGPKDDAEWSNEVYLNPCHCHHGTPATGDLCADYQFHHESAGICASCDEGFVLQGGGCHIM
jgi:hypothetical protein